MFELCGICDETITQEVALYRAVILRALLDSIGYGIGCWKDQEQIKADAKNWLLHNQEDFQRVCGMANLDHEVVRQKSIVFIEKNSHLKVVSKKQVRESLQIEKANNQQPTTQTKEQRERKERTRLKSKSTQHKKTGEESTVIGEPLRERFDAMLDDDEQTDNFLTTAYDYQLVEQISGFVGALYE